MERITEKQLDGAVKRLNGLCGISVGGGQSDISCGGFVSKRELWNQIQAIISARYAFNETVTA